MQKLAPIIIYFEREISDLNLTLRYLFKNELASSSNLFIICKKRNYDINSLRESINQNFKPHSIGIEVFDKDKNSKITNVISQFGSAVVLNDRILVSKYFLNYINDALNFFEKEKQVFGISGFNFDSYKPPLDYESDIFFSEPIEGPWAWATWKDRWNQIDHLKEPKIQSFLRSKSSFIFPTKTFARNLTFDGNGKHYDEISSKKKKINFLPFFTINTKSIIFQNIDDLLQNNSSAKQSYLSLFYDPLTKKNSKSQKKKRIKYFILGILLCELARLLITTIKSF